MNVFLDTVGCRLNQSEIEAFAAQFRAAGHAIVARAADADLVVVNTCAVTAQAASDSRGKLRQVARQSGGSVVATGCWASLDEAAAQSLVGAGRVVPNGRKDHLVAEVLGLPAEGFDLEPVARRPLPGARARTRAFLKAQDGCDNHCTFCITRVARGPGRSRPAAAVLADALRALEGGAQEIVLTGVHLGSWGQDFAPPARLRDLVALLLDGAPVLPRLRLSSLEPWDLDSDFFALWADERLCPNLHLPLQSGSAGVLRRMARKTTPESFARLVEDARRACPGIAVTTDLIAGFPGESAAEHAETLAFLEEIAFAGGHAFPYSPRPGTPAARMAGQVAPALRKARAAELRAALADSAARYRAPFIGSTVTVLWEATDSFGPGGWRLHGLAGSGLRVTTHSPERLWNQLTRVRLDREDGDGFEGTIV